jgi:hypothetical protein
VYDGVTTCWRVPAVVVIVRCAWLGVKSGKKRRFVQSLVPGHVAVYTVPDAPSIVAWTVIGPAGAF